MDVLRVEGVTKSFRGDISLRKREVLRGVTFHAGAGEILGFLGPNGAGKTTTIKIILGLLRPDSGAVTIFGRPAGGRNVAARIGYLPETPYFYPHLTLREFLEFCGGLSDLSGRELSGRVAEALARLDLEAHAQRRLKSFSKGMLQRAGLAQAILHEPDLLILDEPFSGLDPLGRKTVRDILLQLKRAGKTIFFSSHILPDMEALCDRTAIIRDGVIARSVSLDEVFRIGEGPIEVTARGCTHAMTEQLRDYLAAFDSDRSETILVVKRLEYVRTVIQHLYGGGAEVLRVVNQHQSLEDVFLGEIAGTPDAACPDDAQPRPVAAASGRRER